MNTVNPPGYGPAAIGLCPSDCVSGICVVVEREPCFRSAHHGIFDFLDGTRIEFAGRCRAIQ